jgi:hypothetical protein
MLTNLKTYLCHFVLPPQDVIAEARDVESYPEARGISKGSRPAKVLVKKYGESGSHKVIQQYAQRRGG